MSATPTYEVHLADVPDAPEHVTTDAIHYYDSGVWVETDDGRTFFPWGRVTMIHEPAESGESAGEEAATAREDEPADEGLEGDSSELNEPEPTGH